MIPTPTIKRILVPHDFGETAEHALAYALAFAEKFGASIMVLHAYECPSFGFPDAMAGTYEFASVLERTGRTALDVIEAQVRRPDLEIQTMLRRGTPWVEIASVAKDLQADLIVMGTHGLRGLPRALLGSVAEKVVRTAPCPVLTVHLSADEERSESL
jgi:nucleotide-binding universal stress UspA family protein